MTKEQLESMGYNAAAIAAILEIIASGQHGQEEKT